MAGDFSCTEMGPGEVTGQDTGWRLTTTCFLDIPAPGLRVRSRGRALSSQPQGNVSMLSGGTSDLTFMSTNTAVVPVSSQNTVNVSRDSKFSSDLLN